MNLAIAVVLAIVLSAALFGLQGLARRLFGAKCLNCGRRPLEQVDFAIFYDPPPPWSLHRCSTCGEDFIWCSGSLTPRSAWRGAPDAEETFRRLKRPPD